MALNQEQFDALVNRLESSARKQPAAYKLRLGLLAALGYAYIFLILVGLLAIFGLFLALIVYGRTVNTAIVKLGVLILIPAFVVLKSLFVHFPPPTGLELKRQQVPRLFALINELTSALKAPKFHRILLTSDFNAAVAQRPRLGIFGWQRNYLILGLPLMQSLSPEQFRAVLAHELGHLSGNHNRFNGWIYRLRKTWDQLLERLQQSGSQISVLIFEKFFNWYAPFFDAYSFVLARMNEYEADRCSGQLAGVKNSAEALINTAVKVRFLEHKYWPSVYKQVEHLIEPPATTFTNMSGALATSLPIEDCSKWLEQALTQKTNTADTHPCLSDRLSALGYSNPEIDQLLLSIEIETSAAEEFLENELVNLTNYFNQSWQEQVATPWRQRYAYVQESLKGLQELDEKAIHQQLTLEEAWNRACWTAEFKEKEQAIALFQDIVNTNPEHTNANYALGQILLENNDSQGIDYIEKAMAKDLELVVSGCDVIYFFLKQQGKIEEAKAYQQRAEQHYDLLINAKQERSSVMEWDSFQHHNLPDEEVKALYDQLVFYPQIKQAYLVQKLVRFFPEKPLYVLLIKRKVDFLEMDRGGNDTKLVNQLVNEVKFPGPTYIFIFNEDTKQLAMKMCTIKNSAIYKR